MKDPAPAVPFCSGRAMAKANDVRAPKKRSMFRPVAWSTNGALCCAGVEVASSPAKVIVMMEKKKRAKMKSFEERRRDRRGSVCDAMLIQVGSCGRAFV